VVPAKALLFVSLVLIPAPSAPIRSRIRLEAVCDTDKRVVPGDPLFTTAGVWIREVVEVYPADEWYDHISAIVRI
jgi:hypothetical protein